MFAVSRWRGGLDLKLDDIADRPGAALVTGYGANGRYPRRYTPLSSRRAAGDQQIREPQQQRDALVLCHAPVAPWRSRSAASRTGTDAQPSPALALLGRLFGDALAQQPAPPRLHRHTPLIPVLGTLLHPLVACVRRRLSAMQQRSRLRHSLALAAVVVKLCARPDPASTPMCAFIPKYQCISGSRARRRFFVDDGANFALSICPTTLPRKGCWSFSVLSICPPKCRRLRKDTKKSASVTAT